MGGVIMSRHVKLSVMGRKQPFSVEVDNGYGIAIDEMLEFLKEEVSLVLPEEPDFIILPEACDRPINLPVSSRKAYYRERGTRFLDFYRDIARDNNCYIAYSSITINLDYAVVHLDYNWEKLRAMKEKYGPGVSIHDPSHLGAVLISSEIEGVSAMDMISEFEIELLDDYMTRSLEFHRQNIGRDFAESILDI